MTTNRRIFLQQLGLGAAGFGLAGLGSGCHATRSGYGVRDGLPRRTPEAEGISSAAILAFVEAAQAKHEMHSFMLVRHGRVVAEGWWAPYGPQFNHTLYSMSKSFTSTAVGMAVAEGRLTVNDQVMSFFPEDRPAAVSENLAALRIRHLLSMSVGNETEPTQAMVQEENWVKSFLAAPITHAPGSTFMYNSGATYMCSAIVQQVTGQKMLDYLKPRLFGPLGIAGMTWETCPRGINVGGWGLSVPTVALAKLGQVYLREGMWQGRRLLPAHWVREATSFQIQQPLPANPGRPNDQNDWLQGYCYQFWRSTHQAYRGDGAFGQYTIVLPDQDAVIAITSESKDMQGQLDLVWEHLLPAMQAQPLPAEPELQARLLETLTSLALPLAKWQGTSPTASRVSGRTFKLGANELDFQSVAFDFTDGACVMTLTDAKAAYPIRGGLGQWQRGETILPGTPPRLISGGAPKPGTPAKVAASGAWTDENTFELLLRYYETPHHDTVTCRFDGEQVTIAFMNSIAAMSATPQDKRPVLQGQALPA